MRGSAPAPRMWGSYPHAPAVALYSTYFLIHRHCLRPRIVRRVVRHDPRPVHPGGPANAASFRRAIGADKTAAATPAPFLVRFAPPKTQNPKPKTQNPKPKTQKFFRPQAAKIYSGCCGFSRPIRASPQVKKSGSHARRDAGQGSWYRMYLTIRGRQRIFSARISWNAGQRGSQGDTSPRIVRGRSSQNAGTQCRLSPLHQLPRRGSRPALLVTAAL